MMEAHARDSAALCSWAAMMEQQVKSILLLLLLLIIIAVVIIDDDASCQKQVRSDHWDVDVGDLDD